MGNLDPKVVKDFGKEWGLFKQSKGLDLKKAFNQYFHIFPWERINQKSIGFDMGCGSGRWAKYILPKVGKLNCIDPSEQALNVARDNLNKFDNCIFKCASVDQSGIQANTMDFGYCLGVLHHIPNTFEGLKSCVSLLKPSAPLLIYLYYKFDNRPLWFKLIWKVTDIARRLISTLPFCIKIFICGLIGIFVYYPIAKIGLLLDSLGMNSANLPLYDYRNKSIYFMMTDALDRFGTRLEKRFTKLEIIELMKAAGLENIKFSNIEPYWVALGYKKKD